MLPVWQVVITIAAADITVVVLLKSQRHSLQSSDTNLRHKVYHVYEKATEALDKKYDRIHTVMEVADYYPHSQNKWWGAAGGYLSGARCRLAYDATATQCLLLQ